MPIKVTCGGCGVTLKTPDTSAGKRAKCPKCGHPIVIPDLPVEEEVFEAEPSPFAGLTEEEMTSGEISQDQRKPCPACGEMIVREAAKCRFCGEIFDSTLKQQEQKKQKKKALATEGGDLETIDWFLAILCSNIGCIFAIVWLIQGKPKGKKMLLVCLCAQAVWFFVGMALEMANQNNPGLQ